MSETAGAAGARVSRARPTPHRPHRLAESPRRTVEVDAADLEALLSAFAARGRGEAAPLPPVSGALGPIARAADGLLSGLEAERDALRRFAGDAAHQLRTPLAVLAARIDAPVAAWNVSELRADLQWMGRLVDQLLTASKASAQAIDERATFDLRQLATEAVSALAPLAIYRGRALALDGAEAADIVHGVPALAFEALSNLIENALDHTAAGTTVSVRTRVGGVVEVADRGPGVPAAEKARIFERFRQGGRPTTGGAGLGLSIVREIMEKHGGTVSCRDRRGGGAVFALAFRPVRSAARQEERVGLPCSGRAGGTA